MKDQSHTVSVASLNTAGLPGHLPPIEHRAIEICRFFENSDLQVVNLQEMWRPRYVELFRRLLPSYEFVAWQRGIAGQPRGGLVTLSRLPLGKVHYTSFRSTRSQAGSARFRLGMRARSALHGVLTVELPSARTVVGNVHLVANFDGDWSADNRHHRIQRAQIAILQQAVAQARAPEAALAIVSGDLNVASSSPLYPSIVDDGSWHDPFAATDVPTFHAEYLPTGATAQRIDYLLVAGDQQQIRVDCGLIFGEPVVLPDGRSSHLSDHFGLQGKITFG